MAAKTAGNRYVSGECPISVGTGTSDALEWLGTSEDGVSIEVNTYDDAIMTDVGGSQVPVDFQRMGQDCIIRVTIVDVVDSVMRKIANRRLTLPDASVHSPAEGVAVPRGTLIGQGGQAFKLSIAAQWEDPFYFPTVKLLGARSFTVGTKMTKWKMVFQAWPYVAPTVQSITALATSSYPILYARAIP